MESPDRKSTQRRSSTESTSSRHVSSLSILTGPSSLVPQISVTTEPQDDVSFNNRLSGGAERRSGNQLGVPRGVNAKQDTVDLGAVSDSEVGRVKSGGKKMHAATVGPSFGKKIALRMPSKECDRDISESLDSENRLNSSLRTLRTSDSIASTSRDCNAATRRISCKDLGNGQCQGWLMKRKEAKILASATWSMRWCVLHNKNLYYYKTAEWDVAEGVIHLPGFKVSPAPEIKNKKFAFKAHNPGMTIFFATERQDDMAKWMNKLALASLGDALLDLNKNASFLKPELRQVKSSSHMDLRRAVETDSHITAPYSESEESTNESTEDLTDLYRNIRHADLDLAGSSVKNRRSSIFPTDSRRSDSLDDTNSEQDMLTRKLLSLKRTLKDKEQRLSIIERFIEQSDVVTSESLRVFIERHPHVSLSAGLSADSAVTSVNPSSTLPSSEGEQDAHVVQMRSKSKR